MPNSDKRTSNMFDNRKFSNPNYKIPIPPVTLVPVPTSHSEFISQKQLRGTNMPWTQGPAICRLDSVLFIRMSSFHAGMTSGSHFECRHKKYGKSIRVSNPTDERWYKKVRHISYGCIYAEPDSNILDATSPTPYPRRCSTMAYATRMRERGASHTAVRNPQSVNRLLCIVQ